ncbi:MAG: hypothetical protein QXQ43_03700 [Nitrososphaerota archaeon]
MSKHIEKLRQILRDYTEKNALPFSEDGKELADDDLEWAILTAMAEYNTMPPLTMSDIDGLHLTAYVLVMNLALAKALKLAGIRHARDSLPYGTNVQVMDVESKPSIYMSLAEELESKMLQFIKQYKRAIDSRICGILTTIGAWVPDSLLMNENKVISYE